MARDNALGLTQDYQSEISRFEKETSRAREKLSRSKIAKLRANERLGQLKARATEQHSPSLLSSVRGSYPQVDSRAEEAEIKESLQMAVQSIGEDQTTLLTCLRRQEQVTAAAAMGFEECEVRLRESVADALRALLEIELEAAAKRLEDF